MPHKRGPQYGYVPTMHVMTDDMELMRGRDEDRERIERRQRVEADWRIG